MRWRTKQKRMEKYTQWHKWFAWHPIRINNTVIWLETIYRKGTVALDSYDNKEYLVWSYNIEGPEMGW